jgi:hypothetical protein
MSPKQRVRFLKVWSAQPVSDPDGAYAELDGLRTSGRLTAERVLDVARDPGSALHDAFEWDDGVAANEYRLIQARSVIRAVVIVGDAGGEDVRAFIHVPSSDGGFYETGEVIAKHVDMAQAALEEAQADVRSALARVRDLSRWFATGEKADAAEHISKASAALSTAEVALSHLR